MRFAIITVTEKGKDIASNIVSVLKQDPTVLTVDTYHKDVKNTLERCFNDYDCWVGIMASGIMIRSICPLIKSKLNDPAVLVVSENSKHVISLLSGHMGGANANAIKMAGIIGAIPVITTSTDIQGKMGVDVLATYLWLEIGQTHIIKNFNQHLSNGGKIDLYIPSRFKFLEIHPQITLSYNIHIWDEFFIRAILADENMDMYPKKMVAGIGSRKGVTVDQVFFAIRSALQYLHIPIERLDALATADIKQEEDGIKGAAIKSELPLEIVPLNTIKRFHHPDCTSSELVQREFGVPGVSEPSALIQAGEDSKLIMRKTAFDGVTVAIAIDNSGKI